MSHTIPSTGAATPEQMHEAHRWWIEAAKAAKINMKGFKPNAPLAKRKAWAARAGLEIATMLSRYSTKLQRSTESQIRQNVEYAARKGMYLPPEYIRVDEAQKGSPPASRRPQSRHADPRGTSCPGPAGV